MRQSFRVFQFLHQSEYRISRKLHQLFARLLRKRQSQKQNIRNHILSSKICSRCSLRRLRNQIVYTSKNARFFQAFSSFIRLTLFFTSGLQSIKASQLVRIRKRRIREVFNSIRSRNRIASNSFSANDLRNRSFYHTKHRFSFACIFSRYQAFRHTKCQIFHVFNQ